MFWIILYVFSASILTTFIYFLLWKTKEKFFKWGWKKFKGHYGKINGLFQTYLLGWSLLGAFSLLGLPFILKVNNMVPPEKLTFYFQFVGIGWFLFIVFVLFQKPKEQ